MGQLKGFVKGGGGGVTVDEDPTARAAAAFDQSPIGKIVLDRDAMIVQVNSALCNDFGYNPLELIGKHINFLVPERYHKGHTEKVRSVIDREIGPSGWRDVAGKHKDGRTIKIKLSVYALDMGLLHTGPAYGMGLTEMRK